MSNKGLKIAISGKGGVGKTTVSALLAHILSSHGKGVIAVDADPDANLGIALGFSSEALNNVTTLADDRELIKERTGAEPGTSGQMFSLNPQVDDISQKYTIEQDGIRLLQMGKASKGGSGCFCPESGFLKHLLRHLFLKEDDALIVDMEAGLEHMGRGTAGSVDAFIVVVEPGQRSIQTANSIVELAKGLGVSKVFAIANKVRPSAQGFFQENLDLPILGEVPFTETIIQADLDGKTIWENNPELLELGEEIYQNLCKELNC